MSDPEETPDTAPSQFTQAGALSDPALSQLRDQIKKVMIPLLIRIFQLKLELSQSLSPPSRIQSTKNRRSPEATLEQLKTLDNDLKALLLWCQSCRSQIQKAIQVPEEEQKNTLAATDATTAHPAVTKSFSDAVSQQSSFFQQQPSLTKEEEDTDSSDKETPQKSWWAKILRK